MPILPASEPHSRATRLFHASLAMAIVAQLATSQVMRPPEVGAAGDIWFTLHQYSGLTAAALALGLWGVMALRQRGTALGALLPWASSKRLKALGSDMIAHLRCIMARRLPPHDPHSPLASAVHGLGLVLMSAMAATGVLFYLMNWLGMIGQPATELVLSAHKLGANLVWAYLIGHAGIALLHHLTRQMRLSSMWSLRP